MTPRSFFETVPSDFDVFCQVILQEEYQCVPQLPDVRSIIDAGANVGYATRYFLARFPDARILAIEPDPSNAETLRRNLSHEAVPVEVIEGAVWPTRGHVSVLRGHFRDGREWATQVGQPSEQGPHVPTFTMRELISRMGNRIDILKIDIEGAETAIFAADPGLLSHVRCCVIELHDETAVRAFYEACAQCGLSCRVSGEMTLATRGTTTSAERPLG